MNRLEARQGWLITHLITTPGSPNGTSEFLTITALKILRDEGCSFLTVGIEASNQLGEIVGLSKFYTSLAHRSFKIINQVFHLNNRAIYWKKFQPQIEPAYVLFSKKPSGLHEILALFALLMLLLN